MLGKSALLLESTWPECFSLLTNTFARCLLSSGTQKKRKVLHAGAARGDSRNAGEDSYITRSSQLDTAVFKSVSDGILIESSLTCMRRAEWRRDAPE